MFRKFMRLLLGIPLIFIGWLALVQLVRHFYKFPMPQFMAPLIDNPWRRKIQLPEEMPLRRGLEPGMHVLEVGPGNGRYSELSLNPDYPTPFNLSGMAVRAGFNYEQQLGGWFTYTLSFRKP